MTILEHIFSEFVDYAHRPKQEQSEYNELLNVFSHTADQFLSTLSAEQRSTAMQLEAQRNLIAAMDEEFMFCYGFRIGAKLFLELLHTPEQ